MITIQPFVSTAYLRHQKWKCILAHFWESNLPGPYFIHRENSTKYGRGASAER